MKSTPASQPFHGVCPWPRIAALFLVLPHLLGVQAGVEQALRDPTLAPLSSSPAAVSAPTARAAKTLALVSRPLTLIERNGRRYVVLEGHLYAEGQNFGLIRIERVRETEVWFRDGTALYKMSIFPGIERRTDVPDAAPTEVGLPFHTLPR